MRWSQKENERGSKCDTTAEENRTKIVAPSTLLSRSTTLSRQKKGMKGQGSATGEKKDRHGKKSHRAIARPPKAPKDQRERINRGKVAARHLAPD